ncbi:MAG TPA: hypothetical protein VNI83_13790, partial [Vicinamibacterales bacterium]|nr:hypothetical protein [Vicinamibacterales bacterium]
MALAVEPAAGTEWRGRIPSGRLEAFAARVCTAGPRYALPVAMPWTGAVLGCVPRGTPDDVREAVVRARR